MLWGKVKGHVDLGSFMLLPKSGRSNGGEGTRRRRLERAQIDYVTHPCRNQRLYFQHKFTGLFIVRTGDHCTRVLVDDVEYLA